MRFVDDVPNEISPIFSTKLLDINVGERRRVNISGASSALIIERRKLISIFKYLVLVLSFNRLSI